MKSFVLEGPGGIPGLKQLDNGGAASSAKNYNWSGTHTFSGSAVFTGTVTGNFDLNVQVPLGLIGSSANAFAVGLTAPNPAFNIDTSTASSATGLNIKSAAAGGRVALSVLSSGSNESISIDPLGTGNILLSALVAGSTGVQIGGSASVATAVLTVKSSSANALTVGLNGSTNPALKVDASTASMATGLLIKSFAAGSGLNLSVITSGTNEQLKVDAAGSGVISIGSTSTGQVSLGRGSAKPIITSSTISSLGTTQNSTPTAAQLVSGIVTQTGSTGAGTVTLDNGTNISGAVGGVTVGDTFQCNFINLGGGQTLTITSATGATVVGNGAVPTGKSAILTFVNTGANAWNVYVAVSA